MAPVTTSGNPLIIVIGLTAYYYYYYRILQSNILSPQKIIVPDTSYIRTFRTYVRTHVKFPRTGVRPQRNCTNSMVRSTVVHRTYVRTYKDSSRTAKLHNPVLK